MTGIFLSILIVAVLVLATILFLRSPVFGGRAAGARLERIRRSPQYREGRFQNQSATPQLTGGASFFSVFRDFAFGKHPGKHPDMPLRIVKSNLKEAPPAEPVLTWFGHSSYLLQVNGQSILVDPVFSERTSPVQFAGSRAFAGTHVFTVDDLPPVDVLLITHDHYDHLDYGTVRKLRGKVGLVITSLGVGAHLERWGFAASRLRELDWGESVSAGTALRFTAAPSRHFSGRSFKANQTLWSSFVLEAGNYKIYIGGDSGYDSHFAAVGRQYGPFDLAILENGQYNAFWANIHMMPEETVQAAADLGARLLFPVHWGKFALATHRWDESPERALREAAAQKMPLLLPQIGERVAIAVPTNTNTWWTAVTRKSR